MINRKKIPIIKGILVEGLMNMKTKVTAKKISVM